MKRVLLVKLQRCDNLLRDNKVVKSDDINGEEVKKETVLNEMFPPEFKDASTVTTTTDESFPSESMDSSSSLSEKPSASFQCLLCAKKFTQNTALAEHLQERHSCDTCSIFVDYDNIVDHCEHYPEHNLSGVRKGVQIRYVTQNSADHEEYLSQRNENDQLQCGICDKIVHSEEGLKSHVHDVHRTYHCVTCCTNMHYTVFERHLEDFPDHKGMKLNAKAGDVCLGETLKQNDRLCKICGIIKDDMIKLLRHQFRCHKQDKTTCEFCGKIFLDRQSENNRRHFDQHVRVREYICEMCGKAFKTKRVLITHLKQVHDGLRPPKKKFVIVSCHVCDKQMRSDHIKKHYVLFHSENEKSFECETCDKMFHFEAGLKRHEKTHLGIKQLFKCSTCGKTYTRISALKHHKKISHETQQASFECKVCCKAYKTKQQLVGHTLRAHKYHDKFKCSQCSYACPAKSTLDLHMNTHTGARPFVCEICNKGFTQNAARDRHKLVHSGAKPFKCDYCGVSFNQKCSLTRHLRVHTGDKPYKCDSCGMSFTQGSSLTGHKKVHHGTE